MEWFALMNGRDKGRPNLPSLVRAEGKVLSRSPANTFIILIIQIRIYERYD